MTEPRSAGKISWLHHDPRDRRDPHGDPCGGRDGGGRRLAEDVEGGRRDRKGSLLLTPVQEVQCNLVALIHANNMYFSAVNRVIVSHVHVYSSTSFLSVSTSLWYMWVASCDVT